MNILQTALMESRASIICFQNICITHMLSTALKKNMIHPKTKVEKYVKKKINMFKESKKYMISYNENIGNPSRKKKR